MIEIDDAEGCRAGDLIGMHGVRVRKDRCTTCVFHSGNRMCLNEGGLQYLIHANRGGWLVCHQTLPMVTGRWHTAAVCRGWEGAYGLGIVLEELVAAFGREDVE